MNDIETVRGGLERWPHVEGAPSNPEKSCLRCQMESALDHIEAKVKAWDALMGEVEQRDRESDLVAATRIIRAISRERDTLDQSMAKEIKEAT